MRRSLHALTITTAVLGSAMTATLAVAQTGGVREVSATERGVIPLQTRLRYTTMVVLPEGDEILDVLCGDRDFWVISATQTIDDFASADLLRTVVESCPTKLLLANPALERARYAELFQMNEMELDLLAGLMPRRQILLKRPDLTKVLTLAVDPKSYWIYTNTPIDNDRVAAVFREHGFEAGLDRLAASA